MNLRAHRIKKTVGATTTFYPFGHYEVSGTAITKYYFFGNKRIAMRKGTALTYLHTDHLGGTVLETNASGTSTTDQKYFAYGKQRDTGPVVTDHRFTGQKQDASGLVYMNARYYDPLVGMFISPDTIVPDPGVLIDYNRFAYARANPLKYNDPTGHCAEIEGNANGLCLRTTKGKITGVVRGGSVFRNYAEVAAANLYYGNDNAINALPRSDGALNVVGAALYDVHEKINGRTSPLPQLVGLAGISQIGGAGSGTNPFTPRSYIGNTPVRSIPQASTSVSEYVTMYRGTNHQGDADIMTSGTLQSHGQRAGVGPNKANTNFLARFWHSMTSTTPPSQYVSVSSSPKVAARFGKVYAFEVPRSEIYKAWWNPFGEAEFLAPGGTQIYNTRPYGD